MDTIAEYLKRIEKFIIEFNGELSLIDEYKSHLEAEFHDFVTYTDNANRTLIEIEKKFVRTLEDPEIIAHSLVPDAE